ncbi:hypothetical protein M2103_002597 [Ereboglobus sp. PH5-5]|uniref:hypothetical protein n=1 Tax=Ereboglobus sp. PH5-5 TaxID=2940529 RepID=UPI002405BE30|nr:hypothetical protein [Ereboglobus sp. PH5-5]MDF9834351.1 hypothetical protein [Ereboglobus sp. PH5-5]
MNESSEMLHELGAFDLQEAKRLFPLLESSGIYFETHINDGELLAPERTLQLIYGMNPDPMRTTVFVKEGDIPKALELAMNLFPAATNGSGANPSAADAYDPDYRVTDATTPKEKEAFINAYREYYAKVITDALINIEEAKAALFVFFSQAVRAGLKPSDAFDMLTGNGGILHRPEFQLSPDAGALIEFIKRMDVGEIYADAGVPPERDFCQDATTGEWSPKAQ